MPTLPKLFLLPLFAVMAFLLSVPPLPVTAAEPSTTPSLHLIPEAERVTLRRRGGRVSLNLGVWIAAIGGDFEIRARRTRYDRPVTATQTDSSTGETIRPVPGPLVSGWSGLRGFLRLTVRDAEGDVVTRKRFTYCPNGWSRQRIDDTGPELPRYPEAGCGGFAFLKGMVWGIDQGWATSFSSGARRAWLRLPTGRYTMTVGFGNAWADLLGIARGERTVDVGAVVKDAPRRRRRWPIEEPHQAPLQAFHTQANADVPTLEDPSPVLLPDLAALPVYDLSAWNRRDKDLLSFASTPWNAGPAPLVVEGFRRRDRKVMDAFQYFYDTQGFPVGRVPIGEMRFHRGRGHNHWHFPQFVRYDILDADKERVVKSGKQGFCIVPTDAVDLTLPGAAYRPWNDDRSTECGQPRSLWVREVLNAGWGDTYYQSVAGQAFDITDVPNGRYIVRMRTDPRGVMRQQRTENDVALRRIRLSGRPGARRVHVRPYQGIRH